MLKSIIAGAIGGLIIFYFSRIYNKLRARKFFSYCCGKIIENKKLLNESRENYSQLRPIVVYPIQNLIINIEHLRELPPQLLEKIRNYDKLILKINETVNESEIVICVEKIKDFSEDLLNELRKYTSIKWIITP